jgi:hypothetical protein
MRLAAQEVSESVSRPTNKKQEKQKWRLFHHWWGGQKFRVDFGHFIEAKKRRVNLFEQN